MSIPFNFIFAGFLIVVFIVVAFIAARAFLSTGQCYRVGIFYDDLQGKVDEAWHSQKSDFEFEVNLPSGIERICFANLSADITGLSSDYNAIRDYYLEDANLFLIPVEKACDMGWKKIEHINLSKIILNRNPYCVDVGNKLVIKKDFYDGAVRIS